MEPFLVLIKLSLRLNLVGFLIIEFKGILNPNELEFKVIFPQL